MTTPSIAEALRTPADYRRWVQIQAGGDWQPWSTVAEPWQQTGMPAFDVALMQAIGAATPNPSTKRLFYRELPRGHSKTTDLAIAAGFAVAAARRLSTAYWIAEDQDQGRLAIDAIAGQVQNTPGLATLLEVNRGVVRNIASGHPGFGSELRILAADSASSYGITPAAVFIDEFSHWTREAMWHSVFSAAAKKPECLLCIISNAGIQIDGDWRWQVRENARQSAEWCFSSLDGPHASWITPATLEQQKLMLPSGTFKRLWLNQWVSGSDRPLLPRELITAAIRDGCLWPHGEIPPSERNCQLFVGFDVARSRDKSVITTVQRQGERFVIREVFVMTNRPFAEQRAEARKRINRPQVRKAFVDRGALGAQLSEELAVEFGAKVEGVMLGAQRQGLLAETTRSLFDRGLIHIPCDAELQADLALIDATESTSGLPRIETRRSAVGHGDRFWSLSLAIGAAGPLRFGQTPSAGPRAIPFGPGMTLHGLPLPVHPQNELFATAGPGLPRAHFGNWNHG